jgi:PKHD-type hydroxylase
MTTAAISKLPSAAEYFKNNQYVLLDHVFEEEVCDKLCEHLFHLCEEGQMVKDDQCPLSDAVYGDPVFDQLLGQMASTIGQHLGKELLPTYTYARIYRPGDVLERHTDRPACEISGTMTLGFDGKHVWPIYVGDENNPKRIDIPKGSLLMYMGEKLPHWRPAFKGQWQCQVFFHYVDANGPHAAEQFDRRPQLGLNAGAKRPVEEQQEVFNQRTDVTKPVLVDKERRKGPLPIYGGVMIPSLDMELPGLLSYGHMNEPDLSFNPQECEQIIALAADDYAENGSVGGGGTGRVNKEIRNVNLYQLPLDQDTKWIFDKISRMVSVANSEHFDYEIMGITHELQLLHYESGNDPGHYHWHMDIGPGTSATRKISLSIQLSDPNDYEGGDLIVNSNGETIKAPNDRGVVNMFPSYCVHQVTPMKSGERWALVIWVHGTKRFR